MKRDSMAYSDFLLVIADGFGNFASFLLYLIDQQIKIAVPANMDHWYYLQLLFCSRYAIPSFSASKL